MPDRTPGNSAGRSPGQPQRQPRRDPFTPERTDQLNRAIDRAMIGGPTPILNDADLQELLNLATRLRDDLPRDIPDPAFRDDLKRQLTRDRIESLPLPTPAPARARARSAHRLEQKRLPALAVFSAAAVMVALLSIGVIGLLLSRDGDSSLNGVAGQGTVVSDSTASALGVATTAEVETPEIASRDSVAIATQEPDADEESNDPAGTQETAVPSIPPTQAPGAESPQTTVLVTATVAPQVTSERSLAALPAVDQASVEQGPTAFAEGGSDGPDDDGSVEFVLNTDLPIFATSAPVYRLSPPVIDSMDLVTDIAARLGIDGEVIVDEYARYREFHVDSADGRTFRWIPETGAFQYGSLDNSVVGDLTGEEASAVVREWLAATGYPVEQLAVTGSATTVQEGQWQVELALASMPQPGVGHPLGVRAFVNEEGAVLSVTGYWLVPELQEQAMLRTSEECWSELRTGAGYWRDGGMSSDGGELSVVSLGVSYLLTRDENGLVLQPVVHAEGDFTSSDGLTESRISVFIQAARSDS